MIVWLFFYNLVLKFFQILRSLDFINRTECLQNIDWNSFIDKTNGSIKQRELYSVGMITAERLIVEVASHAVDRMLNCFKPVDFFRPAAFVSRSKSPTTSFNLVEEFRFVKTRNFSNPERERGAVSNIRQCSLLEGTIPVRRKDALKTDRSRF